MTNSFGLHVSQALKLIGSTQVLYANIVCHASYLWIGQGHLT
jgi:hypothetical protein